MHEREGKEGKRKKRFRPLYCLKASSAKKKRGDCLLTGIRRNTFSPDRSVRKEKKKRNKGASCASGKDEHLQPRQGDFNSVYFVSGKEKEGAREEKGRF